MAMAILWGGFVISSVLFSFTNGTTAAVGTAAMEGAAAAVELCLSMGGMICLWSGIMAILKGCGVTDALSRFFHPLLRRLMPNAAKDPKTMAALSSNLSCNLLGLGNAATPLGMEAAKRMAQHAKGTATNELCLLVVMNTASIQLLPTTVAGVRAALGSKAPFDILPAVWLASALSVTVGILSAKIFQRFFR